MTTISSDFFTPGKLYEFDPSRYAGWDHLSTWDAGNHHHHPREYHEAVVFLVVETDGKENGVYLVRALMPDGVMVRFVVADPERAIVLCHSSLK